LEVGCGPGSDAATLVKHGFEVTAFDRAPLERAKANAPEANLLRADLSGQLPFRDGTFDAAVSSLALHYLPWNATLKVFAEVRRVVRSGAEFLFRVNAEDDFNHGAGEGEELERGFYRTPNPFYSESKRFFDEAMVRSAVEGLFEILHLEHKTIHRYDEPKRVWECLARTLDR
jgi:SAM-dependent methyltransferase